MVEGAGKEGKRDLSQREMNKEEGTGVSDRRIEREEGDS